MTDFTRYINNAGRQVLHKTGCSALNRAGHENCLLPVTDEQARNPPSYWKLCTKCFPTQPVTPSA